MSIKATIPGGRSYSTAQRLLASDLVLLVLIDKDSGWKSLLHFRESVLQPSYPDPEALPPLRSNKVLDCL